MLSDATHKIEIVLKRDYEWDEEGIVQGMKSLWSQVPKKLAEKCFHRAIMELNKREDCEKLLDEMPVAEPVPGCEANNSCTEPTESCQ